MPTMSRRRAVVHIVMHPWVTVMMLFDNNRPRWHWPGRRTSYWRSLHHLNDFGCNALLMQMNHVRGRQGAGHAVVANVRSNQLRSDARPAHRDHFLAGYGARLGRTPELGSNLGSVPRIDLVETFANGFTRDGADTRTTRGAGTRIANGISDDRANARAHEPATERSSVRVIR